MIIFDLSTLADDTHRRHFIDPTVREDVVLYMKNTTREEWVYRDGWDKEETRKPFQPDYKAYNAACGDDEPIHPVWTIADMFFKENYKYSIWTDRCESFKKDNEKWLSIYELEYVDLKMRPIGNTEPAWKLKEQWLDDHIAHDPKPIDFVFDSDPNSISMWKRRGVFVFDCRQGEG